MVGANSAAPHLRDLRMDVNRFAAAGVRTESAWVPGFGHFYPMGATTLGNDMSKLTLEARVVRFLARTIGDVKP